MVFNKDNQLVTLGETNFRNQRWRFGIKQDDRRRHMYVVGSTGMGKSEFLKNMAIQDIEAGRGVAFIDPHGDSANDLLDFVPKERMGDVIYFDPGDLSFPIAFNVMDKVDFEFRHLVASGLLAVFKKIWPDVWSPRMEYILNNTILALLEFPEATLLSINKMLASKEYRKKVIEYIKDPIVKAFWTQEFAGYTERYTQEAVPAIQNKIGQFISNNLIRNIIGQPNSTLDIRKIMDSGKILLVNISRGKIGEDASRLLGSLIVNRIQLAAMSRVDIPEPERKDYYLYVDEFQHFATESFANILSEARKYHLNLIMAHQYIKQMEEEVMDAVFGNVGTIVSFRVGAEDAEYLEKWFTPDFLMNDIVNLGKYNVYLKLMIDGISSKGFSAATIPPFTKLERSFREEIVNASRKVYATPREIVEKNIADWAGITSDIPQPKQQDNYNNRQSNSYRQSSGPAPKREGPLPQQPQSVLPTFQPPIQRQMPSIQNQDKPLKVERDKTYEEKSIEPKKPEVITSEPIKTEIKETKIQSEPMRVSHPVLRDNRHNQNENRHPIRPENAQERAQFRPKQQYGDRPQERQFTPQQRPFQREQRPFQRQDNPSQYPQPRSYQQNNKSYESEQLKSLTPQEFKAAKDLANEGLSLDQVLKAGPVNFHGKKIEERKERPKVEVNTDELKKVLEEAMGKKE